MTPDMTLGQSKPRSLSGWKEGALPLIISKLNEVKRTEGGVCETWLTRKTPRLAKADIE
jgi:hypothetical protein